MRELRRAFRAAEEGREGRLSLELRGTIADVGIFHVQG
jgi:hypothetical protein